MMGKALRKIVNLRGVHRCVALFTSFSNDGDSLLGAQKMKFHPKKLRVSLPKCGDSLNSVLHHLRNGKDLP